MYVVVAVRLAVTTSPIPWYGGTLCKRCKDVLCCWRSVIPKGRSPLNLIPLNRKVLSYHLEITANDTPILALIIVKQLKMRSILRSIAARVPAGRRSLATVAEDPSTLPEASSSTSTAGKWTPYTQRTGLIAKKRGMTALWDQDGRRWPVTVLQVSSDHHSAVISPGTKTRRARLTL